MAPEILKFQLHDEKVDVWAVGILVFELFHNREPFSGKGPNEILNAVLKGISHYEPHMPKDAVSIVKMILKIDKYSRPNLEQVFNHPFLRPLRSVSPSAVKSALSQKNMSRSRDSRPFNLGLNLKKAESSESRGNLERGQSGTNYNRKNGQSKQFNRPYSSGVKNFESTIGVNSERGKNIKTNGNKFSEITSQFNPDKKVVDSKWNAARKNTIGSSGPYSRKMINLIESPTKKLMNIKKNSRKDISFINSVTDNKFGSFNTTIENSRKAQKKVQKEILNSSNSHFKFKESKKRENIGFTKKSNTTGLTSKNQSKMSTAADLDYSPNSRNTHINKKFTQHYLRHTFKENKVLNDTSLAKIAKDQRSNSTFLEQDRNGLGGSYSQNYPLASSSKFLYNSRLQIKRL